MFMYILSRRRNNWTVNGEAETKDQIIKVEVKKWFKSLKDSNKIIIKEEMKDQVFIKGQVGLSKLNRNSDRNSDRNLKGRLAQK